MVRKLWCARNAGRMPLEKQAAAAAADVVVHVPRSLMEFYQLEPEVPANAVPAARRCWALPWLSPGLIKG